MEDNDDDFFSDDGFEDLPPGTLLQLEQNAYRATQPQPLAQPPSPELTRPSHDFLDPNAQPEIPVESIPANATLQPPARLHTGLTNDYDALDVGELDAEVLDDGDTSALEQADVLAGRLPPPQLNRGTHVSEPMEIEDETSHLAEFHQDYDVLAQKLAWENDRYKRMQEELGVAKALAETKAGEIAIIRSNQTKLAENYEQQLAALRKQILEESTRHREDVEAARAEGKMFATENAFLKQDLAEESMRINHRKAKGRAEEQPAPETPRKTKVLPFRDGFNDDEILAVSPTKSTRSKRNTPTVPGKRKRRLSQDSPTGKRFAPRTEPLVIDEEPPVVDLSDDAMEDVTVKPPDPAPTGEDQNARLMKRILNHQTFPNTEPDIEVLAQMTFPSEPERKLSAILLEETTRLQLDNYLIEYGRAVITLWICALKERYYAPIPILMAVMRSVIAWDAQSHAAGLIEHLVPVLQDSGDINGVPRFKYSPVSRQNLGQIRQTPLSQLQPLVDSTEALGLLFQVASACLHVEHDLELFWRYMRYDFILMMLHCSQPLSDLVLTFNLLSTSIRTDSFGPVLDTPQDQIANENYIVDRVANMLSERPQTDEGHLPYTAVEVCHMRLEALSLLISIAFNTMAPASTHGSEVIASHPTVLARLIRSMHDELDALYSYPPEKDLHASLVNGLMRLVYGVIRRHPEQVDLQSKLCRVPGGKQKFLVVLTRLAFSEGLVLEEGVEDETVEMAHEILDDAVNPQEAEALQEAFSSSRREE